MTKAAETDAAIISKHNEWENQLQLVDQENNLRLLAKIYPILVDAIRILKNWHDTNAQYDIDTAYLKKMLAKNFITELYIENFYQKKWNELREVILRAFDCSEFTDELFIVALTVIAHKKSIDVKQLHNDILLQ